MHRSDEQLPEVEAHREQRPEAPVEDDDEVVLAVAHEDVLHAGVAVGVGLRQPVELAEHGQRQLDLLEQGGPQVEVAHRREKGGPSPGAPQSASSVSSALAPTSTRPSMR